MISAVVESDVEGRSSSLVWRTAPAFVCRNWGNLLSIQLKTADHRNEIWTRDLQNAK
jgi:hypothetical protein